MRLIVLIYLYLTFLEASVGSLIYPEEGAVQPLLHRSRWGWGNGPGSAGGALSESSHVPVRPIGWTALDASTELLIQMPIRSKPKAKLATKKPFRRVATTHRPHRRLHKQPPFPQWPQPEPLEPNHVKPTRSLTHELIKSALYAGVASGQVPAPTGANVVPLMAKKLPGEARLVYVTKGHQLAAKDAVEPLVTI